VKSACVADATISFADICIWRDVPKSPAAKRVPFVINPNVDDPTVVTGLVKLAWLRMSNASARIWSRKRSVTRVFLTSARSRSDHPGPVTTFLPRFPNAAPWFTNTDGF